MKSMAVVLVLSAGLFVGELKVSAQQVTPATLKQQPDSAPGPDVGQMRSDIRDQNKQMVAANLPLTADEAGRFWPVYDQYTAESVKVNDQRLALINEYVANSDSMTDDQASSYMRRWISLDQDATRLRLNYIPIFEKVLAPKKALLFFQIDRRLGLVVELQLASVVPLVAAANN
jgi:hypothetical protein